jgi:hypothetical protein
MKRRVLIALCALFTLAAPGFAQNASIPQGHESEYYYVNVRLDRVYPYRKGYVVSYRKNVREVARLYLPQEWFSGAAAKGELIRLQRGTEWPSLTIYYKGGEFSHVRLYVRPEPNHESWGNIPLTEDLDRYFEDVTDLKLEH